MKLFTIDTDGKFIPYTEHAIDTEVNLEILLEKNPEYFFENSNVLLIGRQVVTNLNSYIDLLGIDKIWNSVVIELKRDKTPRETIAQILEYSSFIDTLDYNQLNEIFQKYAGEENVLDKYHQQYFQCSDEEQISFNKSIKLIIVAQTISQEIKQTALYLRKKGIDINCIEFKYFTTSNGEKILSSDIVVGGEDLFRTPSETESLPLLDETLFKQNLDENGVKVFSKVFEFIKQNSNLKINWGSKGFTVNYVLNGNNIRLFSGYSLKSVYGQIIQTNFSTMMKFEGAEEIISFYREQMTSLDFFNYTGINYVWVINRPYNLDQVNRFLALIDEVINRIRNFEILK